MDGVPATTMKLLLECRMPHAVRIHGAGRPLPWSAENLASHGTASAVFLAAPLRHHPIAYRTVPYHLTPTSSCCRRAAPSLRQQAGPAVRAVLRRDLGGARADGRQGPHVADPGARSQLQVQA